MIDEGKAQQLEEESKKIHQNEERIVNLNQHDEVSSNQPLPFKELLQKNTKSESLSKTRLESESQKQQNA